MKAIICSIFMLVSAVSFAQHGLSEDNAKMMIDVFFDGFHKGDTTLMSSVMVKNMRMQTVYTSKTEGNKMSIVRASDFLTMVANRPAETIWEEQLHDYKIDIDGNLAHVWTPYTFKINGNLSHCGANSFTIVNTDDGWKIYYIIDSRRVGACE